MSDNRIRKITRIENDKTVYVENSNGPSAQDLIDALSQIPDKTVPVDIFLDVAGPDAPTLGLLISTMGYNPITGGASMIVIPDTRPESQENPNTGMWPTTH